LAGRPVARVEFKVHDRSKFVSFMRRSTRLSVQPKYFGEIALQVGHKTNKCISERGKTLFFRSEVGVVFLAFFYVTVAKGGIILVMAGS